MCEFLQRHGLHNRGLWRRECACSRDLPWGSLAPEAAPPDAEIYGGSSQPSASAPESLVSMQSAVVPLSCMAAGLVIQTIFQLVGAPALAGPGQDGQVPVLG